MPDVVKELETALQYQELYEGVKPIEDFKKMLLTAADNLNYGSKSERKMRLLKGILANNGNTWLSCDMDGDHCEMISIAACLTSTARDSKHYIRSAIYTERFAVGCYEPCGAEFKTHVRAQFLSPGITYTVNLVFKRKKSIEQYIGLEYKLEGEEDNSYSFVSDKREDGWLTAELYQLTTDQRTVDLKILFYTKHCDNLLVEGIEFRPAKKVEHEALRGKNVDMQLISDTETRPRNICLMLPAKAILKEREWNWDSKTRFGQVAYCISEEFVIFCEFSSEKLSPQTTYATYLVYSNLPNDYDEDDNPPMQVVDKNSGSDEEYNIFLCTPQTPLIRGNFRIKGIYNPSIRPMIKGIPKERSDGWMEVQVHEFQTPTNIGMVNTHLRFSSYDMESLKGFTVQGLEFRPI